jgi:hypothetical protein
MSGVDPAVVASGWLERSERVTAELSQEDRFNVASFVGSAIAATQDVKRLRRLLDTIDDRKKRTEATISIVASISASGDFATAVKFAETLDESRSRDLRTDREGASIRDLSVYVIVLNQLNLHDFAGAKKTLTMITSKDQVCKAWYRVAEAEAESGRVDDAATSAANIRVGYAVDADAMDRLRRKIRGSRRLPAAVSLPVQPRGYIDGLRQTACMFSNVSIRLDDLNAAESDASRMAFPDGRGAAWRKIAMAYCEKGDRLRCERAIREELKTLKASPSPSDRLLPYVFAADIFLDLGEPRPAEQLAEIALNADRGTEELGLVNAFATTPYLVSVLVRTGHASDAAKMIPKLRSDRDSTWYTFAVVCGLAEKNDSVQSVVAQSQDDRTIAVLCAGVARGIQERLRKKKSDASRVDKVPGTESGKGTVKEMGHR